ncbi:MAG: hypothetical protein ACE5KY_02775 [Candidatus Tectimicrobiota bacterium]
MEWIVALVALIWLAYFVSLVRKRRGQAQRMAVYLDKARELKRKSEEATRVPGKLKRLGEAIEQLHKALHVKPRDPRAKELLAQYQAEREALAAQSSDETEAEDR